MWYCAGAGDADGGGDGDECMNLNAGRNTQFATK